MTNHNEISKPWIWLRGIISFLCFSGLGLILLELYVDRVAWLVDPNWYRIEKNQQEVQFSCQRFRPIRFNEEPDPAVKRIIVVGGSTTFAFPNRPAGTVPLEKNIYGFVGIISETLNTYFPKRFEVINLGINGGGSTDGSGQRTLLTIHRHIEDKHTPWEMKTIFHGPVCDFRLASNCCNQGV